MLRCVMLRSHAYWACQCILQAGYGEATFHVRRNALLQQTRPRPRTCRLPPRRTPTRTEVRIRCSGSCTDAAPWHHGGRWGVAVDGHYATRTVTCASCHVRSHQHLRASLTRARTQAGAHRQRQARRRLGRPAAGWRAAAGGLGPGGGALAAAGAAAVAGGAAATWRAAAAAAATTSSRSQMRRARQQRRRRQVPQAASHSHHRSLWTQSWAGGGRFRIWRKRQSSESSTPGCHHIE